MTGVKFKNPRLSKNYWTIPNFHKRHTGDAAFVIGQALLVKCVKPGYIPCFPKPGSCGKNKKTRIQTGNWVTYIGATDFNGVVCHEFISGEEVFIEKILNESFYIGEGSFAYLVNIPTIKPKRIIRSRGRKKPGSPVGKRGGRRKKPNANKKRPGSGLDKAPLPKESKSE